jgi:toxin YoeB
LVKWSLQFKNSAKRDAERLAKAGLKAKAEKVLNLIEEDPYRVPPPCEKLVGDLTGLFSRRINLRHRLVYEVVTESREVMVYSMFSHYGD